MKNLAQINLYDPNGGYLKGFGALGLETKNASEAPTIFAAFISSTIGLITLVAIIWFVFNFISGAVGIISSGGDKQALESAKKKITSGLIGLIVTILALILVGFVGAIIGLGDILNFQKLFQQLIIK